MATCDRCWRQVYGKNTTCGKCQGRIAIRKAEIERGEVRPVTPLPPEPTEAEFKERWAFELHHARIHFHGGCRKPVLNCAVCALWQEIVRLRRLCASVGIEPAEIDREYPETDYGKESDPWNLPLGTGARG